MQPALPATVLGDFSNATLEHFGMTARFFRDDDRFMVRIDGPDHMLHDYPIAYTFGVYPLQQYLIVLSGGRYQVLGMAWDSSGPKTRVGSAGITSFPTSPCTLATGCIGPGAIRPGIISAPPATPPIYKRTSMLRLTLTRPNSQM